MWIRDHLRVSEQGMLHSIKDKKKLDKYGN